MPPRHDLQNLNLSDHDNIVAGLGALTNERNLPQQLMTGLMTNAKKFLTFLKKPRQAIDALAENAKKLLDFLKKPPIFVFFAGFGFNLAGIGGGSLAAAFQSAFYGGLTPAGGLFATLQSMGMLGTLLPVQVGVAGVGAAVVSGLVWVFSRGRE